MGEAGHQLGREHADPTLDTRDAPWAQAARACETFHWTLTEYAAQPKLATFRAVRYIQGTRAGSRERAEQNR